MSSTRRRFLGELVSLSGVLAAVPPGNENYWRLVTEQFSIQPGKIMMNAANLCPAPRAVAARVAELARDIDSDVSSQNRAKFATRLEESRKNVGCELGVSQDEIALVRNTSEANNIINNGAHLKGGDEIVIFDQNHPCNNVAWDVRAARLGFTVNRVVAPPGVTSPRQILNRFEAAITAPTTLLSTTYISHTTGVPLPAKELCAIARDRGIYSHVDGAQVWGFLKLDLKALGCDSFSASAHKWLIGPKKVGLPYVREARVAEIWANIVTVGWGLRVETTATGARKFEVLGQSRRCGFSSHRHGHGVSSSDRAENIEARTLELAAAVHAGLSKISQMKMTTPADVALRGGVIVAELPPGVDRGTFANSLYSKHGVAGAPVRGVRLAPHIYNINGRR